MMDTIGNIYVLFFFDAIYSAFYTAIITAIASHTKIGRKSFLASSKKVFISILIIFFALSVGNHYIAQTRAEKLVACCESYKLKYGKYPDELADIVPEFIDGIPQLNYLLFSDSRFHYHNKSGRGVPILIYTEVGYMHTVYNFETKEWSCLG